MSRQLPPLDLHAHINPEAHPAELERLGSVVFAATRSLDEYASVQGRRDQAIIWGVGCHPGQPKAQAAYDAARFAELISSTGYASEVGLDRQSRVTMERQREVLASILGILHTAPRITAIHSSGAPGIVLDLLEQHRIHGAVLHWWRGDAVQTRRALRLGCWFSLNAAGMKYPDDVAMIPLGRALTETDHPSGDRGSRPPRQPGAVADVESTLAALHGVSALVVRQQVWSNFAQLVDEVDVEQHLPHPVRRMLAAARQVGEG